MGRPAVDVAHELTEADAGAEVLHVAVRGADRGRVEEHEVDAGDDQDAEQHRGDEAEPERVADAQHPGRDPSPGRGAGRSSRTTGGHDLAACRASGGGTSSATRCSASIRATRPGAGREGRLGLERVPGRYGAPRVVGFSHRDDLPCVHHRQRAGWAAVDAQPAADAEVLVEQQHALRRARRGRSSSARAIVMQFGGQTSTQRPHRMHRLGSSITLSKQRRQRSDSSQASWAS